MWVFAFVPDSFQKEKLEWIPFKFKYNKNVLKKITKCFFFFFIGGKLGTGGCSQDDKNRKRNLINIAKIVKRFYNEECFKEDLKADEIIQRGDGSL